MNADRSDLPLLSPDTDEGLIAGAFGFDSIVGESPNEHLLEVANVATDVATIRAQVHNRVAHQLAGPMVGDLPAPVGLEDLYILVFQPLPISKHIPIRGAAAQGKDMRMFEQQQMINGFTLRHLLA